MRPTIYALIASPLSHSGVTTFVCLMTETELVSFRPYKEIAIKYAAEEKNRTVGFLSFPIPGIVHPHILTKNSWSPLHITCAYD